MSQGPDDDAFADVLNGITGGPTRRPGERRGLFGRRRRADAEDDASAADQDAARALDGQPRWIRAARTVAPRTGCRSARRRDHSRAAGVPTSPARTRHPSDASQPAPPRPVPADTAAPTTPAGFPVANRHESGAPDYPDGPRTGDEPPESSFVRPYAWTRGRTRPAYDLAVETLLSTTDQGRDPEQVTQYEHRMIADLCSEPKSVAEVGALLSLPLGVARVLLGDMAAHGSIVVHETASSTGDAPDMALMERVLSGLRRL